MVDCACICCLQLCAKHGSVPCCLLHPFWAVSFRPITSPTLKQTTALEQTVFLKCYLHLVASAAVHLQQNGITVAGPTVFMHTTPTPTRFSNTQSSSSYMHATPVLQLTVLLMHCHALGTVQLQKTSSTASRGQAQSPVRHSFHSGITSSEA